MTSFVGRRGNVGSRTVGIVSPCRSLPRKAAARANGIDGSARNSAGGQPILARGLCAFRGELAIVGVGPRECVQRRTSADSAARCTFSAVRARCVTRRATGRSDHRTAASGGRRGPLPFQLHRRLEVQPLRQQRLLIVEEKEGTQKRPVDAVLVDDVRELDLEPLRLPAAGVRVSAGGVVTDRWPGRQITASSRRGICRDYGASGDTAEAAARVCAAGQRRAMWTRGAAW